MASHYTKEISKKTKEIRKGTLNVGSDADFVILGYPGDDLPVLSTWIGGKSVFHADATY